MPPCEEVRLVQDDGKAFVGEILDAIDNEGELLMVVMMRLPLSRCVLRSLDV